MEALETGTESPSAQGEGCEGGRSEKRLSGDFSFSCKTKLIPSIDITILL